MPETPFAPRLLTGVRKLSFIATALLPVLLGSDALARSASGPAPEKTPVVASEPKSPPDVRAEAKAAKTTAQEQAPNVETAAAPAVAPGTSPASAATTATAPNADKLGPQQAGTQSAPGAGGLVVFIDPVTKQIRQPEAGEMQQLVGPEMQKVVGGAPLVRKTLPGGGVGIVLDSSFDSYTVVTKQPDGKLSMGCVTGEHKAEELVSTGAPVSEETTTKEAPDVQ